MRLRIILLYYMVLIDTWWNVNSTPRSLISLSSISCFNRYMVECEYYMNGLNVYLNKVLIDTWWNVNFDTAA